MAETNNVEWRYENFSCWDKELHGNCLQWYSSPLDVYPGGLDGNGEHLIVMVWDEKQSSRVELSYIGADGSLLCKQEVLDPQWKINLLILPPGPKFEEYIRTTTNKDVLTLRLYLSDNDDERSGCATIDVLEKCLKIPAFLFKDFNKSDSLLISDLILKKGGERYEFCLNMVEMESTEKNSEISIELILECEMKNILIHAYVSLLNHHDEVIKFKYGKLKFQDEKRWKLPTTFKFNELNEKGSYILLCLKLVVSGDILYTLPNLPVETIEFSSLKPNIPSGKDGNYTKVISSDSSSVTALSQELMCLYQDQDFSDFHLKCNNISFSVHRNILSSRSPVFKNMLSCDMQEAATGSMDVVDMDPSTLARFLTFLYTGTVEDLQCDLAAKLYYAADKYQVPTLKRECSNFLCANVSILNVCDVLVMADKHQDDRLRSVGHDFILDNFKAVMCSKEWKSFMEKEPLLGVKTLTQFAEQNVMRVVRDS